MHVAALAAAMLVAGCTPAPVPAPQTPASMSTSARQPRAPRSPARPADARAPLPARLDEVTSASDTFDGLRARYGDTAIRRATLPGPEGEEFAAWLLFPDDPARRLVVRLDEAQQHPVSLIVRDGASWTRADGIRLGMDTRALDALNGRPFAFSGFGWDYGGTVTDWKGGRLEHGGRSAGFVRLCEPPSPPSDYPSGDGEFMSDDPAMAAKPARVCEFDVDLVTDGTSVDR